MRNRLMRLALVSSVLVGTANVMADDFSVDWWTVDGGGDMWTSGGDFEETDSSGYARIAPGDLLTTSDIPGYAAKVTDHQRAQGAVLGKAMERLEKGEKGRILVLVTLQ